MKKVLRSSQVLTIVLVTLALSSVFFGVESAWAADGPEPLSMSAVEDVSILGSGTALVKLLMNVGASPLADMYRELLAAPYDAGVGEAMPIPENKTENGGVAPVRQEYYRSIKQEQMVSFGFGMRILNSSMVPRDEQNGCKVSIDAVASPQVVSITDVGSDVIFEVVVGPQDENATGAAFAHVVTKVAFAQQMLDSVEGEQVYELEWTTRIKLPAQAALLNGDELDGLSWVVNFGAGTSMSAFVSLDGPSTVVLSERTVVAEQNVTATLGEIFEAFRGYKVFTIRYQLPESALAEGEDLWTSAIDRDWSFRWNFRLPFEIRVPFEYTFVGGKIYGTLTFLTTFSFSGYIGWDIDWVPWPRLEWFKAWIGIGAELKVTLDAYVIVGGEHTWERTLYDTTLYRFTFAIGFVPVWADLDFSVITRFTVGAEASVHFWAEATAGASLKAGVRYRREAKGDVPKGWSPIWEPNLYADLERPTIDILASAHAEAFLAGRLSLMIYSVAGPFIEFGPYVRGDITYYAVDEVAVWKVRTGLKLNVGITFCGFLKDLLGLNDYYKTLGDWTIEEWSGYWGEFPSAISCNVDKASIGLGSGTRVRGTISCNASQQLKDEIPWCDEYSKSGTVYIQYSNDTGATWDTIETESNFAGEYSRWWVPPSNGTYLFRCSWEGNDDYKEAESEPPYATVEVTLVAKGPMEYSLDEGSKDSVMGTPSPYPPGGEPFGWAVRLTAPVAVWVLQKIMVYGCYTYGDGTFYVEVWDSSLNTLFHGEYKYSQYFDEANPSTEFPLEPAEIPIIPHVIISEYEPGFYGERYYYIAVFPNNVEGEHELYLGLDYDLPFGYARSYEVSMLPLPKPPSSAFPKIRDWIYTGQIMIHGFGASLVENHTMCERVETWGSWGVGPPINPTGIFYLSNEYAYSWLKFQAFDQSEEHTIRWEVYTPPTYGNPWGTNYYTIEKTTPAGLWGGTTFAAIPINSIPEWYTPYLGRTFRVDIFYDGKYVLSEYFQVTKRECTLEFYVDPYPSITLGQSVQLTSRLYELVPPIVVSPGVIIPGSFIPVSGGTVYFQYSTDNMTWVNIASGPPSETPSGGYYSYKWTPPHGGTYYLRARWNGTTSYYGKTSHTITLTVNPRPSLLTTTLSENPITYGSNVTITASMTPALQGRNVTFQYSNDTTTWYNLGLGTTDSAGQCTYEWAPDVGTYYIRAAWNGDDDYLGFNSTSVTLTVDPLHDTIIEIVSGADAEVDRNPEATVEFGVRVKDAETGQYLTGIGRVEFYVSDQSYYRNILIGSDNDTDGDGIYQIQWTVNDTWPVLGPQPWGAYFTGTLEYMPNSTSSTFTIYYYGVALWIDPTFQEVNVTSTETHTVNFKWNRDTTDIFDLSLTGLDPTWYTLSQPSIPVETKGQTEQVTLTVTPPNAPTILTDYEFAVTATSQEDPSFSVSATATPRVRFTPTLPPSPTGGLAITVQPQTIYALPGTTTSINILVVNNQNFDDVIIIDLRNTGIQLQYQANLTWFNWIRVKVFLPAGASINIPLEIEVPADTPLGIYDFRAVATSTSDFAITAEDSGTINAADTAPPTTTITLDGTAGLNGWYVSDVTVTFTKTDDLSGVASTEYSFDETNWIPYTGPITISSEGTTTIYYRSIDNAGNIEGTKSQTIMIDKTAPVISGAPTTSPNAYGWYNADVTILFVASDIVSGIDYVTPDQTLTAEGADQSIIGMARDIAGNVDYFTVTGINIDKTLPSISGWATVSPNVNGWYKTDVTIHFEATDSLSGVDSVTADQIIATEGEGQSVTGMAIDKAGNVASFTVLGINIDKTPPSISGAPTTSPNVHGWYKTDVVIHFEASDLLSGIETLTPDITLSTEGAGQSATGTAVDNAGNEASYTVYGINIDKKAPTTSLTIGEPKYISDKTYVTPDTPFTLEATDARSGVHSTAYRIYNATYDSGWQTYTAPFKLTSLTDGTYTIEYNSTDNAGNIEPTHTVYVTLDNSGPSIVVENPPPGWALQDGVTFIASASDSSGTQSLNFSIREANGEEGIPVGFEDIPATFNATTGKWELFFDTLQLPDGFYIVLVSAEDNLGHTASITVPYSIRNWAVLELLPATPNNKAGRAMPVKFALRVAASVDPTQPFVYNEELTIKIYTTDNPSNILQTSTFGDTARDYRISSVHYITNFRTLRTPMEYTVAIYRDSFDVGSFTFKTTK